MAALSGNLAGSLVLSRASSQQAKLGGVATIGQSLGFSGSSLLPSTGISLSASPLPRIAARSAVTVRAAGDSKSVLIVNTNSGGHAVIGFALARQLATAGHNVTIMTVGEEFSDKMKKEPFSRFGVSEGKRFNRAKIETCLDYGILGM